MIGSPGFRVGVFVEITKAYRYSDTAGKVACDYISLMVADVQALARCYSKRFARLKYAFRVRFSFLLIIGANKSSAR